MSTLENNSRDNRIALYVAVGKILAMVAQFIMPLFLTRFLSKYDYGIYSQFYLIFGFLLSILGMGVQSNLYYFYPKTSEHEQNRLVWGTVILILSIGSIGCGLFLLPSINHFVISNEVLEKYIFIISLCVFLALPSLIVDPLSVVRKDRVLAMLYHPLEVVSKIVLVISFALVFKTLESIFYGVLILQLLIFIFVLIYICRNYPPSHTSISFDSLKQQLIYSLPFGIAVILNTFSGRFDKLLSISFLSPEEYATYSIAFFGIPGIMQIYDSLCQVNVTNMAKLYKEGNVQGVKNEYKDFVIRTLSFSLPVILIVFVFSPQIIELLFSKTYLDSVPFFRIYILTFVLAMFGSGTILRAINRTKLSMWAYFCSVLVTLPLSYWLIKEYGIWGAILSSVINTVFPKILQIGFEIHVIKSSIKDYFPWKEIFFLTVVAVLLLIPFILLNILVPLNILAVVILSVIYISAVYLLYIRHDSFIVDAGTLKAYAVRVKHKFLKNE